MTDRQMPARAPEPPVSHRTELDAIVQSLEFDILFGVLRPRERLIEDQLIERFAAKRHVVRQALSELERMGIVIRAPNRGASVRDFTVEEVEEIAEVRETLHRRAVQRMQLPGDTNLLSTLKRIQHRHDAAVASRDPRAIDAANEAFHETFFAACGNRMLASAIRHYSYLSRATRLYPMLDAEMLEMLRCEHWAMIDALTAGNRRQLAKLVVEHIQHSKRMYIKVRATVARPALLLG
jgi:DNA-binding GntR family transcriptional regulator